MILCVLITTRTGGVVFERFYGVPTEEQKPWTSFLKKLGAENLQYAREEEELVASHRSFYIVYAGIAEFVVYTVGRDEYDELGLLEVLRSILSVLKDVCNQDFSEVAFLKKYYGRFCLSFEEVVFQGDLELTDKDRVKRAVKLKTSNAES